jgi:RNA polymerase sigma-70 factor (ECF subfamily)
LIKHPERYDPSLASLRTYLYAAARNLSLKQIRQTGGEMLIDDLPEDTFATGFDPPLQSLLGKEVAERVRQAVTDLPPLQREALILFEYEELTLMEIAAIVATDIGTVKSRLHRARERLRRSLSPYYKSRPVVAAVRTG